MALLVKNTCSSCGFQSPRHEKGHKYTHTQTDTQTWSQALSKGLRSNSRDTVQEYEKETSRCFAFH